MTEETQKTIEVVPATQNVDARDARRSGPRKPNRDRRDTREPRVKPEFDQKIISIRRVTRVVTGGRRFSFSVAVVVGGRVVLEVVVALVSSPPA